MQVSKIQTNQIQQNKLNINKPVTNPQVVSSRAELPKGIDAKSFVNISFYGYNKLIKAADDGDLRTVCRELDNGTDINADDSCSGWTALHFACFRGYKDIVEKLLSLPDIDINARTKYKNTALRFARSAAVAEKLIQHPDIQVNAITQYGETALINHCKENNKDIIEVILKHPDVNINIKDIFGKTALDYAKTICCPEIADMIRAYVPGVDRRPNVPTERNPETLFQAVIDGDLETINRELDSGVNVNAKNTAGVTALIRASMKGFDNIVERLLQHPDIDVNALTNGGQTALMWASEKGYDNIVEKLLQHPDINVNIKTKYGNVNALIEASRCGRTKVVGRLLEHPDVDTEIATYSDKTALDIAREEGYETIAYLIRDYQRGVDKRAVTLIPDNNPAALSEKNLTDAAHWGDFETVCSSLDNGTDVNAKDADGMTALMWASKRGYNEIAKRLLQHPDIDIHIEANGFNAKKLACIHRNYEIVAMLNDSEKMKKLKKKETTQIISTKNPFGMQGTTIEKLERELVSIDPIIKASALDELAEHIQSGKFNPNYTDNLGRNIIHLSMISRDEKIKDIISKAISKGVDINAGNKFGQTPLMLAIKNLITSKNEDEKSVDLSNIKFILEQNPNIDIQDKNGQTAFHLACMSTSVALLTLLLSKNPNIFLKDKLGKRAADYFKTDAMKDAFKKYII